MTPRDEAAREQARSELGVSFLVEAGAGTGKTTLLVERLANLVESGVPIESIVAITFTEKAALEMKQRLRDELRRRLDSAGGEAPRMREALAGLESASVCTVHAFCTTLLRERPVEAGVDPGFTMIEGEQQALVDEAFADWVAERTGDPPAALADALRDDVGLAQLRTLCNRLIDERDLVGPVEPAAEPHPAEALAAAARTLAAIESHRSRCTVASDTLATDVDALAPQLRGLHTLDRLVLPPGGNRGNQKNWPKDVLLALRESIAELRAAVERFRAGAGHARATALLREATAVLAHYARRKRERGVLDFQDLLIATRDLLRDRPDVRRDFQARFARVLLDEFQDTDPLMAEIAFFLAEDPAQPPARRWQEVAVGAGRLFLVGDPKQSIYRFRRADVEIYRLAKRRLVECGGRVLDIVVNFRSAKPVLDWVNGYFARALTGEEQPDYVAIEAPAERPSDGPGVVVLAARRETRRRAETSAHEAERVAAWLAENVRPESSLRVLDRRTRELRPPRLHDCAMLFRSTSNLHFFEDALRARSIDFRVAGGRLLFRRAEVKTAAVLFRAIDDPSDEIALVALLRSPLFALPDDSLAAVRAAGARFSDLDALAAKGDDALRRAVEVVARLRALRPALTAAELVEEAYAATRALEVFALKPDGERRVANLRKLLGEAQRLERDRAASFRAFAARMTRLESDPEKDADAALAEPAEDAVQLLTMHKAKGLEFPIVLLADLGATPKANESFFVRRGDDAARLDVRIGSHAETAGFEEAKEDHVRREAAEGLRLLYVAATRARDLLVLPRFAGAKPTGNVARLDADALYGAAAAASDDPRVIDAETLAAPPCEAPEYALDLAIDDPPPAAALALCAERERWHGELKEQLAGVKARPLARASAEPEGSEEAEVEIAPATSGLGSRERAREFGVAVHALFERADFASMRPHALDAAPSDAAGKAALALFERFAASPLARRLSTARRVLREVPFAVELDGSLYEGALDVLAEDAGGRLLIVDWKTDRVAPADVDARAERYRGQGAIYRRAVATITGRDVDEVLLAFLAAGETRAI